MKSNADYWKGRFQQLEKSRHIENGDKYREIEKQFMRSQQAIESKINAWYGRFASNNGVTLEEARKMLNASELKELKWDVEDYIKAGKQNALSKQFQKQLENASAKYHISRLEAIKLQTQMECEKLYGNFTDALDEHIKNQYADAYYKTAFELQKGIGYGHSMERINSDVVEQVISKPWAVDGKNFATRLGESKVKLINNVHNSLTKMCLMGSNPDQAIRELAKTMQGDRGRAGRIIMTESAYFSQNAQKRCFNSLGVEEYEIVATLDSRTCDGSCAGQDGEHYPMKMFEPGVTAPPFHPRCRCCTAPYFNDEWSKSERAARDEDGNTYYVPSDMKYNDWYKAFVKGDKSGLESVSNEFNRVTLKAEINKLRNEKSEMQENIDKLKPREKELETRVYFGDGATDAERSELRKIVDERHKLEAQIESLENKITEKQDVYKSEAEKRILENGLVKEIKLSKNMSPESVDTLETTLTKLKDKYGMMPNGVIYSPLKVSDGTATYNWIDDNIYISNKFNDVDAYVDTIKQSEKSLHDYNDKYNIIPNAKKRLADAENILANKNIKGYEREKALLAKAEAEIQLNTKRMAVRTNAEDVLIHEYGHFIHRHANVHYTLKKEVYKAKELGGVFISGNWEYEINKKYSRLAKVNASKISRYATKNPYETFAEGFLAMEKGEKIPDEIEAIIKDTLNTASELNPVEKVKRVEKTKDSLFDKLPKITEIKNNDDIKTFAETWIDNLGIDRTDINVNLKSTMNWGYCGVGNKTTQDIIHYNEYVLNANDKRPMTHRIKTAFHESFHLLAEGKQWDGLTLARKVKESWRSLEETFTESSAHYLLERYGVKNKIAPSYAKELVWNLPRLKRLDKYSNCKTIQDFGKIAFKDRQDGAGAVWMELSSKMKRVKLENDYYLQYYSYINENTDKLFDMMLDNMPGFESYRKAMKDDLKSAMQKNSLSLLNSNEQMVYYGITSCAMQILGVK